MITKKQVAKQAGVSAATVTNVFNNAKPVSQEIRTKVMEAAQELGYFSKKTAEYVLVVNDASNPHNALILEGMTEAAQKYDAFVSMAVLGDKPERLCSQLISRQVNGVYFAIAQHEMNADIRETLENAGVCVASSWDDFVINFDSVTEKAIKYLADLGHERIAYLSGLSLQDPGNVRYNAFCRVMNKLSLPILPELMMDGIFPYETTLTTGYWAMKRLFERGADFTAVIALNDLMAIGAIRAIAEKGLSIPQDISVIGCDDIPIVEYTTPSLTTFRLPARKLGVRTVQNFIQRSRGLPFSSIPINLELVIRQSTGKANPVHPHTNSVFLPSVNERG